MKPKAKVIAAVVCIRKGHTNGRAANSRYRDAPNPKDTPESVTRERLGSNHRVNLSLCIS
jgi:hypothetical protein